MAYFDSKKPYKMFDKHWQFLLNFFKLRALKFFILWFALVPIILKFTSELPDKINILQGSETYILNLELPFKWQVLWISSLLYTIAFILYTIFCPRFIKDNPSFAKYLEYKHDPRWIVWETSFALKSFLDKSKLVERLIKKGFLKPLPSDELKKLPKDDIPKIFVEKNETKLITKQDDKFFSLSLGFQTPDIANKEKGLFWEIFGHFARSNPQVRVIINILFLFSIGLFAFAVLQNVLAGLKYLLA